ncbi:MAG: amidohydrolase family protein [Rhodospirillales bacterium]|nr:amidohydrolase family protein [Rhodospirillales bacterium]
MRRLICCTVAFLLAAGAGLARAQTATLILLNGKIWTENPGLPEAEALAIEGQRILAVGSSASMRKLAGPKARIIDLQGRRVLPGFNDSHVHFLGGGSSLLHVQLGNANSAAEFRRRLGDYAKSLSEGMWIRAGNWDHQRWNPAVLPTHQLIDDVTPHNPVMVWRIDGHMVLANAYAMKLAGIDRTTKDVPGGEIVRDRDGNPTGILKDEATALVERVMPFLSPQELDAAMTAAMHEAASHGVTSVQNMADAPTDQNTALKFREFQKFALAGSLTVRIYDAGPLRDWKNPAAVGVQAGFGSPLLRTGNLKSFADGALGSGTAWMDAPFSDEPGKSGLASTDLMDTARMYANIQGADQAGLQISIHAIGDRAIHTVLDLFERAERQNGVADRRFRIEHVQHLRPDDAARFAPLGVIASMQPYHAIDDGRWAEKPLGRQRVKSSYAWRLLLDHGAVLAFGSDWPVAPLDPLMGIYAATTRRTLDGKNPQGWVPEQRITVAEAVHAYTVGSAFAEHQEAIKGSLEPGKLADLVVLSDDIFQIEPTRIENVRVDMTIFDGAVIYRREGAGSTNSGGTDLPTAVFADPPTDPVNPATGGGVQFRSHGALINAQLYRPNGAGNHPTVILLHGLPGNEQNLDLAQAIRRAGWTVITFHYRGSWGSGGKFTLSGGLDDARALLTQLRDPTSANLWGVDHDRIVLMGHSYGGYIAARASVGAPGVVGIALVAPWDISFDARAWQPLTAARRKTAGLTAFDDVDGRLVGATASSLTDEVMRKGPLLDLTQLAVPLAQERVLLVTATHDDEDDKAASLLDRLHQLGAQHLTAELLDTDHAFSSARIALQATVLHWLEALPPAAVP